MNEQDPFQSEEFLEEQLVYQMLVYLPLQSLEIEQNSTVEFILATAKDNPELLGTDHTDIIKGVDAILDRRPDIKNSVIDNMSWLDSDGDGKADHPPNGMEACTFNNKVTDPDTGEVLKNDTFVTFRGTSGGAWIDNAKMIIGNLKHCRQTEGIDGTKWDYMSPMEAEALEYMNTLIAKDGAAWKMEGNQYLIGHSKGGNPVQLLMLIYGDFFEIGLSMDGPGISNELYAELQEKLGSEYIQEALKKVYGLNGSNDYVHRLGLQLILPENTRWFEEYQYGPSIISNHFIYAYLNVLDGSLAPFADGPGPVSEFVRKVMEVSLDLPTDEKEAVFMSVMLLLQFGYAKEFPVNSWSERWLEIIADLDNGLGSSLGIVISLLFTTEEGAALVEYLKEEGIFDPEDLKQILEDIKTTYLLLPLEMKAYVASTVANLIIMVYIFAGVISDALDLLEILQLLIDSIATVAEMGTVLVNAYIQIVKEVYTGIVKGCTLVGAKAAAVVNYLGSLFTKDITAESGKVAVHYDNIIHTSDLIADTTQQLVRGLAPMVVTMRVFESLNSTKFWKVDTVPLLRSKEKMERLSLNLQTYELELSNHAANMQKLEAQFISSLGKSRW